MTFFTLTTFSSSLLVIYENDCVADESATRFNVSWSRVSPVCVSLCNDYNCLYITGESNHLMGREAIGNATDVWNFNFATSFSFSLVEQLVGNNIWNTTIIGSVTLGLIESYLNNESLEIFISNGYVFIRCLGDNSALLFLDLETGIVRDCFSYYGLLGTMPCYHDNITENAWNYGNKLLNQSSYEFDCLRNIFSISVLSSVFVESGSLILEGLGGASLGSALVIFIPLFIVLFPDLSNELWIEFISLLNPSYKEYLNMSMMENMSQIDYCLFGTVNNILYLNHSSLLDYAIITLLDFKGFHDKNSEKTYSDALKSSIKIKQPYLSAPGGDIPNSTGGDWESIGKFVRELVDEFKSLDNTFEKIRFVKNNILKIYVVILGIETIPLIEDFIKLLLYELSKDNYNSTNITKT